MGTQHSKPPDDRGERDRYLKVISGLSGSGKSVALRALEDLGYYCVDNLPIFLLRQFVENVIESDDESLNRAAVSLDSRNKGFLDSYADVVEYLSNVDIKSEIIFLDAEESALIKRFNETHRKHPLMDKSVNLLECIRLERRLLAPLSEQSSKHFDTTNITPHELRHLIHEDAANLGIGDSTLVIKSFAYKHGTPLDADYVFDVRCLPNPYWIDELKKYNGLDEPVINYFQSKPSVSKMVDQIDQFISEWMPKFVKAGRFYLTVAIGCTGGRHRSVYVVERLAERFGNQGINLNKRHSDID